MLTSAMFVCFERDAKVPATAVGAGGGVEPEEWGEVRVEVNTAGEAR